MSTHVVDETPNKTTVLHPEKWRDWVMLQVKFCHIKFDLS